jgi:hypothetical protein
MSAPPPQQHEMVHKGTDQSGAEEWLCEECGRHFIVRWRPDYDQLVLHPGDQSAAHFGRKGDVSIRGIQLSPGSDEPSGEPSAAPDEDAWRRWLRKNGIDWDGQVA